MFFVMKLSKLCNLRCTYCYEYEDLAKKDRMPLEGLAFFFEHVGAWCEAQGVRSELHFVFHGGEPMLLPDDYLRGIVRLQKEHLASRGVRYSNSLQTNLFKLDEKKLELLEELGIALGISLDVFGRARVTLAGDDSQAKVLDNLQVLFDRGYVRRLGVGLISVLHAKNIAHAEQIYEFCERLGLSFRMLPLFSLVEPPERMRDLVTDTDEVVAALQRVAARQLAQVAEGSEPTRAITVFPLWNHFVAAVHHLTGRPTNVYDPSAGEWAFIVDTNGDVFNHAEAYTPEGRMGNVFQDSLDAIWRSEGRKRTLAIRAERNKVCEACPYAQSCSRISVVEALPSERVLDERGELTCAVTRPMIDWFVEVIAQSPEALARLESLTDLPEGQRVERTLSAMTS